MPVDPLHQQLLLQPMPESLKTTGSDVKKRSLPPPPELPVPEYPDDLVCLDVVSALALFRAKKLSPVELLDAYLDRINLIEPVVRGWVSLDWERARDEARRAERWWLSGNFLEDRPLCGIPVGVKDIIFTRDLPTTAGSRLRQDFTPAVDAAVITALRRAGAIILGKTTTTEFAYGDSPPTHNPWRLGYTPGGSSSGSAACIAARMVPLALGTQTGGSIVRPAAYCGVSGLMPAQDRIARDGVFPMSWTLDHVGPMAASVRDLRYVMPVLSPDAGSTAEPLPSIRRLRIGIPDRYYDVGLDPQVKAAVEAALSVLVELGARLRPVRLPDSFELAETARAIISDAEVAAYHYCAYQTAGDQFGPMLRRHIEDGLRVSAVLYQKALQLRRQYMAEMRELFNIVDCLAVPSTPTPAPEGLSWTGHRTFNGPSTNADLPSLNVPVGRSDVGLPIGMQLIGPAYGEAIILALGEAYQNVTSWHREYADPVMSSD